MIGIKLCKIWAYLILIIGVFINILKGIQNEFSVLLIVLLISLKKNKGSLCFCSLTLNLVTLFIGCIHFLLEYLFQYFSFIIC